MDIASGEFGLSEKNIKILHDWNWKTQNSKNIKACPLLLGLTDGSCVIKGLIEMRGGYHSGKNEQKWP